MGLKPLDAGCRTVSLDPFLGDLEWAEGALALPGGECVKVKVRKAASGGIEADYSAPEGVKVIARCRCVKGK